MSVLFPDQHHRNSTALLERSLAQTCGRTNQPNEACVLWTVTRTFPFRTDSVRCHYQGPLPPPRVCSKLPHYTHSHTRPSSSKAVPKRRTPSKTNDFSSLILFSSVLGRFPFPLPLLLLPLLGHPTAHGFWILFSTGRCLKLELTVVIIIPASCCIHGLRKKQQSKRKRNLCKESLCQNRKKS